MYPANAFDSRLRSDYIPLGWSPTKSQKKTYRVGGPQSPFCISSSYILFFVLLPFFLKIKINNTTKFWLKFWVCRNSQMEFWFPVMSCRWLRCLESTWLPSGKHFWRPSYLPLQSLDQLCNFDGKSSFAASWLVQNENFRVDGHSGTHMHLLMQSSRVFLWNHYICLTQTSNFLTHKFAKSNLTFVKSSYWRVLPFACCCF